MAQGGFMSAAWRLLARVSQAVPIGARRGYFPIGNVAAEVRLFDPEDALKVATVWRCVQLVAESTAMLPWHVFKRDAKGDGVPQPNNAVAWLLQHRASGEMTAFSFKRAIVAHRLLWGNGYAEIERDGANRPVALHLLDPSRVEAGRDSAGQLAYKVKNADGSEVILPARDIFHVAGLGFDGVRGYSVLEHGAPSLANSMALDQSLGAFFANGFRPIGLLKTKGRLTMEGLKALEKRLEDYTGVRKRWKAFPLDQDMDFQPLAVTPEDAQLVDLRKLTSVDICRLFGVPPHMAFDLDRSTFNNIESQGREFLTYGLMPNIVCMEQEADWKLLSGNFAGLYSKINVNAIVRADIEKRFAAYKIALDSGLNSINEIRSLEEWPNIGPEGDEYVRQVQFQPIGTPLTPQPVGRPAPETDDEPDDDAPPPRRNGRARANGKAHA